MTPEQLKKLEWIKNYSTRYELALVKGDEKFLVVYMSGRSLQRMISAVQDRINAIKAFIKSGDIYVERRKLFAGDYEIKFTGRTQREAILSGELPFIGHLNAPAQEAPHA